jgi:nicotinamide-nucleotide amidase
MEPFSFLVETLRKRKQHITSAESCTAGLFSAHLAETAGASDALAYGFVVYSEEAKQQVLGVSPDTIAKFGVVSEPTAREMVIGAVKRSNADIGVSFTGFAGPGAEDGFPVGRVCFGYRIPGAVYTETVEFGDIGRNNVREAAALHAANRLLELLEA